MLYIAYTGCLCIECICTNRLAHYLILCSKSNSNLWKNVSRKWALSEFLEACVCKILRSIDRLVPAARKTILQKTDCLKTESLSINQLHLRKWKIVIFTINTVNFTTCFLLLLKICRFSMLEFFIMIWYDLFLIYIACVIFIIYMLRYIYSWQK